MATRRAPNRENIRADASINRACAANSTIATIVDLGAIEIACDLARPDDAERSHCASTLGVADDTNPSHLGVRGTTCIRAATINTSRPALRALRASPIGYRLVT